MNKEHFIQQKQRVKSGHITSEFTPYMLEYYKFECKQKDLPVLIDDIDTFNKSLQAFLTIPVSVQSDNSMNILGVQQTIQKGINKVLNYFDKHYEIT